MAATPSLKKMNARTLQTIIGVQLLVFLALHFGLEGVGLPTTIELIALPTQAVKVWAPLLIVGALLPFWLLGILPAIPRDRLVHWRWQHPLPGSRSFSNIGLASARVDLGRIVLQYGPLPNAPEEQNALFYRIYRRYRDDVGILQTHREYLLMRDLAVINAFMTVALPLTFWRLGNDGVTTLQYGAALFAAYALTAWSAQTYASRLVENVLAAASASPLDAAATARTTGEAL